jgi:hypothetical protein
MSEQGPVTLRTVEEVYAEILALPTAEKVKLLNLVVNKHLSAGRLLQVIRAAKPPYRHAVLRGLLGDIFPPGLLEAFAENRVAVIGQAKSEEMLEKLQKLEAILRKPDVRVAEETARMRAMRAEGKGWREIGRAFNVTGAAARQRCYRGRKKGSGDCKPAPDV